jgi:hypothetical protein
MSTPMRRTRSNCCARAANGHAAAPPRSVMNSRRLTWDMGLPPAGVTTSNRRSSRGRFTHFQLTTQRTAGPWADLNCSEPPARPDPSSGNSLEINDSESRRCGGLSRQQSCHHRAESHGHNDEREAMQSISEVDASWRTSSLRRSMNDQSRKSSGSSTFGRTEIFCGKPMPGTANHRGLGEYGCIMISLPSA